MCQFDVSNRYYNSIFNIFYMGCRLSFQTESCSKEPRCRSCTTIRPGTESKRYPSAWCSWVASRFMPRGTKHEAIWIFEPFMGILTHRIFRVEEIWSKFFKSLNSSTREMLSVSNPGSMESEWLHATQQEPSPRPWDRSRALRPPGVSLRPPARSFWLKRIQEFNWSWKGATTLRFFQNIFRIFDSKKLLSFRIIHILFKWKLFLSLRNLRRNGYGSDLALLPCFLE